MKIKILFLCFLCSSCANFKLTNEWIFSLAGAGISGYLGHTLSPNEESRSANLSVFGLLGGAATYLTFHLIKQKEEVKEIPTLQDSELGVGSHEVYSLPPTKQSLPEFVRKRLSNLVIEEFTEKDSVSEDGELHEPHRVWRIKQSPELSSTHRMR